MDKCYHNQIEWIWDEYNAAKCLDCGMILNTIARDGEAAWIIPKIGG